MIGLFAVTAAGRRAATELATSLGPDAVVVEGPLRASLEQIWPKLDAAVFFLATGATVRLIAPLLADKHTDPGIVCVDEARTFAVSVAGGHGGGANELTERVAELLGATAVITTASDATGTTPLDELVGLIDATVDGDLAGCGVALLDGAPIKLVNPLGFPLPALPPNIGPDVDSPEWIVLIDDRVPAQEPALSNSLAPTLRLIPQTLLVGIGSARDVPTDTVKAALAQLDHVHGFDPRAVRAFATVDIKTDEPGILAAITDFSFWHWQDDLRLLSYPADVLSTVDVPSPSDVVLSVVGTPSVAEAAALHAAGELAPGASVELVVRKTKSGGTAELAHRVTVAVARIRPRGRLAVIGLGPGAADLRTPRAEAELRRAAVVVGLDSYVDQVRHLLRAGTEVRASALGAEETRAREAVELAAGGRAVALIGSGDAGIYAMASPALQQCPVEVEVVGVPGVTAALAASALLGAPLGHDHALISLSDLHTPWEIIERRVRAAAEGDFVVCFYNPRSRERHWQLGAALDILRTHRRVDTPVGAVRQASRDGQHVWCAPLAEFDPSEVDMFTTVVVGSSQTNLVNGRMVTPRGYTWQN
ncbi:MAG TPA: precorrin-3B C(17)-methyltransferase [Pseudonocardiaceae bacterium]|nr:precorrin-3B C(17)-methyltransferase [Pseudonocardiaceae bacterium]